MGNGFPGCGATMPQATGHWATIGFLIRTNETHSFDRPTSRARPACQLRVLWADVDEVLDAGDARYSRIQDVSAELSNGVLLLSRICPQRFGVSGCRSTCRLPVRPVGIQLAFARFADGESASVANSGHESGPLVTEPAISARLRRLFQTGENDGDQPSPLRGTLVVVRDPPQKAHQHDDVGRVMPGSDGSFGHARVDELRRGRSRRCEGWVALVRVTALATGCPGRWRGPGGLRRRCRARRCRR